MDNTNYTHEESNLLDEFAKAALQGLLAQPDDGSEFVGDDGETITDFPGICGHICRTSWTYAAAMIAERRKRLPKPVPSAGELLREFMQKQPAPAQPEPAAAPKDGELTEEAVIDWRDRAFGEKAMASSQPGLFVVTPSEIDRAVSLMREGLRAKEQVECLLLDLQRANEGRSALTKERDAFGDCAEHWCRKAKQVEKERDEARAERDVAAGWGVETADELRARAEQAEKERDEARAAQITLASRINDLARQNASFVADAISQDDARAEGWLSRSQDFAELTARAERAEKAEAAFRAELRRLQQYLVSDARVDEVVEVLRAHPAPKAEGGAS